MSHHLLAQDWLSVIWAPDSLTLSVLSWAWRNCDTRVFFASFWMKKCHGFEWPFRNWVQRAYMDLHFLGGGFEIVGHKIPLILLTDLYVLPITRELIVDMGYGIIKVSKMSTSHCHSHIVSLWWLGKWTCLWGNSDVLLTLHNNTNWLLDTSIIDTRWIIMKNKRRRYRRRIIINSILWIESKWSIFDQYWWTRTRKYGGKCSQVGGIQQTRQRQSNIRRLV